jgi:tellurite methyltransferase
MSETDRKKWNERYRAGAYADRTYPAVLLQDWIGRLPRGRALDVACGAGRNALFLAANGFEVDAVDISGEALSRARAVAEKSNLQVNWIEHDLDEPRQWDAGYALVLIMRYVNLPLARQLVSKLAPGGFLVCEQHLVTDADVIGPGGSAFRVKPGQLRKLAQGLRIHQLEETLIEDPDQRPAAVARLVASRAVAGSRAGECPGGMNIS